MGILRPSVQSVIYVRYVLFLLVFLSLYVACSCMLLSYVSVFPVVKCGC